MPSTATSLRRRQERIIGNDLHAQALAGDAADVLADTAEADDGHGLSLNTLHTREQAVIPDLILLDRAVVVDGVALQTHHGSDGVLGRLLRAVVTDGNNGNTLLGGVLEVGGIVASGLEGNHLAVIHGIKEFFLEVDIAVDNDVGVLDVRDELLVLLRGDRLCRIILGNDVRNTFRQEAVIDRMVLSHGCRGLCVN